MNRNLIFILTSILVASLASCDRQNHVAGRAADSDSIPSYVRDVINAVAANDSSRFAELISYPLSRPYPLHDIENPEQMKAYYATLVDDSLRQKISSSKTSDWSEMGWRGYTLDDGQYLWTDSLIYEIPYVSDSENRTLSRLLNEELSSLWSPMRSGWIPIESIESVDGSIIARIDREASPKSDGFNPADKYRLAIYSNGASLHDKPSEILEGSMDIEGTELNRVYTFTASDGSRVIYDADLAGADYPQLLREDASGNHKAVHVKKIYWLDVMKHK
ncbi:MAG: hypothetical protein NC328_01540 [Muribaculum sp.]|nr:hypothetical protein [Muribaculum sp.]